jgi:hypothetical protein
MGGRMATRTTMAGGCFLTLGLLGGFVAGILLRNPMQGVLIGLAAGTALALAVWMIDRWRA